MPGRILVVDDVATNRIILKVKLVNACYDVLQASSGQEALRIAQTDFPDLVLLDSGTGDLGGLDICRKLKANRRTADIPVIILAPENGANNKVDALEAGAVDVLSKPINDMGLLARIRSLLRARGITSELALREGTSQALGFAEPAADFAPAGHICIVAEDGSTAVQWRRLLRDRMHDRIEIRDRAEALADSGVLPDLFLLTADLDGQSGAGLLLLSELRSREATRNAGIIVAVAPDQQTTATMALDLGASDLVTIPVNADELALRLQTVLTRKRQSDRLRNRVRDGLQMAVTDSLTGLYNRRYAMSHLTRIRDRAMSAGKSFAVLLADLDHFKRVNDENGHAAGDEVLKQVASRLSANLRSVDLVARHGGEEFLIVLPDIDPDSAGRAAERLREAVAEAPIDLPATTTSGGRAAIQQTVSIGLAIGGAEDMDEELDALVERADRALYAAKARGRNRVARERRDKQAA